MVDIAIEILASSVLIRNGYKVRYHIKSWWAHEDVPLGTSHVKMPRLPLIQPYLNLNGRKTIVFVEVWEDNMQPNRDKKFLGMATCYIDKQLQDTNLNPAVEWLDVHDPIEGIKRGKLLLKIDAKFSDSGHSHKDEDAPVKIGQSSRQDNNHVHPTQEESNDSSPTKYSGSRKSETSAFSIGSSSVRSFDQGIQTDLSLPILLPDISRYTAALRSNSNSEDNYRYSSNDRHLPRQTSQSCSEASSVQSVVVVDPLKVAERVLLKGGVSSKLPDRNGQESPTTTTAFRRNCLVKQHIAEQEQRSPKLHENQYTRRASSGRDYNLESVDDVIDLLRNGIDSVFISSPTKSATPAAADKQNFIGRKGTTPECNAKSRIGSSSSKPPLPEYCIQDGNNNKEKPVDLMRRTAPGTGTSSSVLERDKPALGGVGISRDVGNQMQQQPSFEILNTNNQIEDNRERFREVHYDGAKAKEQATIMLKTKTAQPTSQSVANPAITRRRIAANIFND